MGEEVMTKLQKVILWIGAGIASALLTALLLIGLLVSAYCRLEYRDWIASYSRENDLDPYYVAALIFCESKYDPNAVSRAGARGLMQVMPATGQEIADVLGEEYDPQMLFDPEISIRFGTRYLRMQMDRFDGNEAVVLAAYNAGPHRAEQWLNDYGLDSKGHIAYIPFRETDRYVDKVLSMREVYRILYWNAFPAE